MYVHVIGWETAKKDKIDLEGSKLKEKQGLYTCPPSSPQQLPFHCCLEVKEEQIKVQQPFILTLAYLLARISCDAAVSLLLLNLLLKYMQQRRVRVYCATQHSMLSTMTSKIENLQQSSCLTEGRHCFRALQHVLAECNCIVITLVQLSCWSLPEGGCKRG